jgi:hypothetical protein
MTQKPTDFARAANLAETAAEWRSRARGVELTSAKHPHSLLDPVEALFHQHGLDINEHAELIRAIEAYVDEVVRYSQ